jgi:hypothetical protein
MKSSAEGKFAGCCGGNEIGHSLGGGDGEGLGLGAGLGEGGGLGVGLGVGLVGHPGAQVVDDGQSQTLAAALKIRPAGQGVTVAAPPAHCRKVAHLASKGLA